MRKVLKWTGIVLGGVLLLLMAAAAGMYIVGGSNIDRTYEIPALAVLDVRGDSAQIARGAHLAQIYGCNDCHTANFAGKVWADAPPFRVVATNLTSGVGGIGGDYEVGDWDRAIRHGVKPNGRSILIMPSSAFHQIADRDIEALIAYLQTIPAVDNELPSTAFKPMGRVLAAGPMKPMLDAGVRLAPARTGMPDSGPTVEYGEYLAVAAVCTHCHGADLRGMLEPPGRTMPAPSLVATGRWSLDEFKHALRTGERPGKEDIDPKAMPLALTKPMTDDELVALHTYFASLSDSPATTPADT